MLQKLNERIQGIIAWVVVILITITFTVFGIDYFLQSKHHASEAVVKVNNQDISKQDLDINFRRAAQMQDREGVTEINERVLKQQVIDDLIMNAISVQAAHKNGFNVSSQQANAAILTIPQFQENGQFSNVRYSQALNNALYTHDTFQQEVTKGMLINQQRFALVGTEFTLPSEIQQFTKLFLQKRSYRYLSIPASNFAENIKVSSSDVESYYNKHGKEYFYPEQVSLEYVQVSVQDIKKNTQVDDDKVAQYYADNRSNYLSPARWKVAQLVLSTQGKNESEIQAKASKLAKYLQKNPAEFKSIVAKESDVKELKTGETIDIVAGSNKLDEYFIDYTRPQQVLDPIKTEQGFAIYQVISYQASQQKPLSEVKDIIAEQLKADAVQVKYADTLEKLGDLSFQNPDSLEMVGKLLDLEVIESEMFDKNGGNSNITKHKSVLNYAFSNDAKQSATNSEPMQLDNDTVAVVRVNKYVPAKQIPLQNVKNEIEQIIREKRAQKQAEKFGKSLVAGGKKLDFNTVVKVGSNSLKWETVHEAGRDSNFIDPTINDLAFNLASVGDSIGKNIGGGNFVIVSLESIANGNVSSLDNEQVSSINQQIESGYGLMDYNLYINGLMKSAKVVRK